MAIKAVLLDVGGVLFVPDPALTGPALGLDGPVERLVRAHYVGAAAVDAVRTWDMGPYCTAYALAAGVPENRLAPALAALLDVFRLPVPDVWCHPLADSVAGLRRLEESGIPIAIVSNSNGTVEEKLRAASLCQVGDGPGVCVSIVVDSHVVGAAKPDPSIFGFALDRLGVEPGDAVYVGDTVCADVAGARAAGLHALHFDPFHLCPFEDHGHLRSLLDLAGELS